MHPSISSNSSIIYLCRLYIWYVSVCVNLFVSVYLSTVACIFLQLIVWRPQRQRAPSPNIVDLA